MSVALSGLTLDLDHDLAVLGHMRQQVKQWLDAHELSFESADAVILATHEAVANAIQHGEPPVRLQATLVDHTLTIDVQNTGLWKAATPTSDERGRGLMLINALMTGVEIGNRDGRTTVQMHLTC